MSPTDAAPASRPPRTAPSSHASPSPRPSESADQPLSAVPPPSLARPRKPPRTPSDQIDPVTVRGVVARGAVSDCMELVVATGRYALMGKTGELTVGQEVEVQGLPSPQVRSACDGTPLTVRSVRLLGEPSPEGS